MNFLCYFVMSSLIFFLSQFLTSTYSFLLMYNLSTSLIVCNAPYIVIVFLDFLSTFFNSLYFHCSIPVPYLNSVTAHVFIAVVLFFPFSFHFRINRSLRLIYSFIVFFFFISSSLTLSNSTVLKYVSLIFNLLHCFIIIINNIIIMRLSPALNSCWAYNIIQHLHILAPSRSS